jgi:hypothetical protein
MARGRLLETPQEPKRLLQWIWALEVDGGAGEVPRRAEPKATAASSALCIVFRIGRRYNAETAPRKVEKYPAT